MWRKFTLIELIIVVAILGILFSMLLPAFSKAKQKFNSAGCKGNLKQLAHGMTIYTADYNEYMMPASFGETDEGHVNHFINYMISYQHYSESNFQCPEMNDDEMFDPDGHDPATGNIYKQASYIMNIIKPNNWGGSGIDSEAHGWGLDSVTPVRLTEADVPSDKMHLTDAIKNISNSHSGVNAFSRSDHGSLNDPPVGMSRWVGNHHFSGYNALFADGHVEEKDRSEAGDWAVNR